MVRTLLRRFTRTGPAGALLPDLAGRPPRRVRAAGSRRRARGGWTLALALTVAAAPNSSRAQTSPSDFADLREDVRGLTQRLGDLSLRVEQLEHENAVLRAQLQSPSGVTSAQLDAAVAQNNAAIHQAVAASRAEILQQVGTQMEKLARETNAAIDSVSRSISPLRAAPAISAAPAPSGKAAAFEGTAKDAARYTVQKGETLSMIAKKTGAKIRDIIEANHLTDPSHIQVGQILFIPPSK